LAADNELVVAQGDRGAAMAKKRVVARVAGLVQGVSFRAYALQEARNLGLSGWVRNRSDGTVEAVLEGEAEKIARMIAWLHTGSPHAQVNKVEVAEVQPLNDATAFTIRYG
jgi:acylphosphatase